MNTKPPQYASVPDLAVRTLILGLMILANFLIARSADLQPVGIQLQPGSIQITAHGITGNQISLMASTNLTSWSTIGGVLLGKDARAQVNDFPGWTLPISKDGSVTFNEALSASNSYRFYRVVSLGLGWDEAHRRWTSLAVDEYRYRFRRSCFCFGPPGEGIVHVKGGKVVDVEELSSPRLPPGPVKGDPALYPTIDGLFDLLNQSLAKGADVVHFHFDPDTGIPTSISVDWILRAADDEVGYLATDFQKIQ